MVRYLSVVIFIIFIFTSCEEVINIELNTANPSLVIEGQLFKDSTCLVRLTRTASYFSPEEPMFVENARIILYDGTIFDELNYSGNGIYTGESIIGTEGKNYQVEIECEGTIYEGISYMPQKTDIISLSYSKSQSQSVLNPSGKTVFTITCRFIDNPDEDNCYMVRFMTDDGMAEDSYYLLTEVKANDGIINKIENVISFSESIFYDGGEIEVQVFSIDKSVYNYFLQLNDILFWKRRVMPPTPYNPVSNINNGALGYFAAWAYDSELITLE